jgi:hypothetical protein
VIGAGGWVVIHRFAQVQLPHVASLQQHVGVNPIGGALQLEHTAIDQAGGPGFRQGLQFRSKHRGGGC